MNELTNLILKQAPKFEAKPLAPSTAKELFGHGGGLVVWTGESEHTIWGLDRANWAFRAIHDSLHLETGLGFSIGEEVEIGLIQARRAESQFGTFLADLIYIETAGQALEYLKTGQFVADQLAFTINAMNSLSYKIK